MSGGPSSYAVPSRLRSSVQWSRKAALWVQALILVTFMAASSAPTPLYSLYRESWGFSATTLTVVFGVYAFSLLLALLVVGSISDHVGRRPVIIAALLLNTASMLLFLTANDVPALIAARLLQGLATGAATSALAAGLMDADRQHSPLINSISPMVGLAFGALGASLLMQFAPAPLHLVFVILTAMMLFQVVLAYFLPDLAEKRPGVWAAMRPTIAVPGHAWRVLLLIAPLDVAGWALGGFYFSLGPTLAGQVTGNHAPVIGGLLVFTLTMVAAVAVFLLRSWPAQRMLTVGAAALMLGVATTLAGVHASSALLFFVGTGISGIGFGVGFLGALRTLVPVALPDERAGLMAAFYIMSYLAFSIPAMLAGVLTNAVGLGAAATYYGWALVVLAAVALLGLRLFPLERSSIRTR